MNPIYLLTLYLPGGATATVRTELAPVAGDEMDFQGTVYVVAKRRFLVNALGNWAMGASVYLAIPSGSI